MKSIYDTIRPFEERWFYRDFDREVGPLSFRDLRDKALMGRLCPQDVVRIERARLWVKAKSIAGLFDAVAADDAPPERLADDLDSMLARDTSSPAANPDAAASAANSETDGCFCLLQGRTVGPLPFEELLPLVQSGQLTPRHRVKLSRTSEWMEAGQIVGLFESTQAAALSAQSVGASAKDDRAGGFELNLGALQSASEASAGSTDCRWYCRIHGRITGPFTFETVGQMATAGRLSPRDEVCCGNGAAWEQASTIVGLFPAEVMAADAARIAAAKPKQRTEPARRSKSSDAGVEVLFEPEEQERRGTAAPVAPPVPMPAAQASSISTPVETPAPVRAPAWSTPSPAANRYAPSSRADFKPTKKSGPSFELPVHPGVLAGVALAVIVGLGLWKFGLPSFGNGATGETIAIWQQVVLAHQPETEMDTWQQLGQQLQPRVQKLVADLKASGGDDPETKQLLRACEIYLPAILKQGPTTTSSEWTEMANFIGTLSS